MQTWFGLLAASIGLALLGPTPARASGSPTIAGAPTLAYGSLEAGGGKRDEFWRIPTVAGDRLTLRIDWGPSDLGIVDVWDPSVDDYTVRQTPPVYSWWNGHEGGGKQQLVFRVPYTGLGILAICEHNGGDCSNEDGAVSDAFTFTLTAAHATSLSIRAPSVARRGSTITVRAHVQSPAGIPQGSCLIAGHLRALRNGDCAARVKLGHGRRQQLRVEFVPDDGWQSATARRSVRLIQ